MFLNELKNLSFRVFFFTFDASRVIHYVFHYLRMMYKKGKGSIWKGDPFPPELPFLFVENIIEVLFLTLCLHLACKQLWLPSLKGYKQKKSKNSQFIYLAFTIWTSRILIHNFSHFYFPKLKLKKRKWFNFIQFWVIAFKRFESEEQQKVGSTCWRESRRTP